MSKKNIILLSLLSVIPLFGINKTIDEESKSFGLTSNNCCIDHNSFRVYYDYQGDDTLLMVSFWLPKSIAASFYRFLVEDMQQLGRIKSRVILGIRISDMKYSESSKTFTMHTKTELIRINNMSTNITIDTKILFKDSRFNCYLSINDIWVYLFFFENTLQIITSDNVLNDKIMNIRASRKREIRIRLSSFVFVQRFLRFNN